VTTTRAQRLALKQVFLRILETNPHAHYRDFRRTVFSSFGCVMVPFAGMILGIEPDGYTHS